ncbi:Dbl homology domain-containing protein, partial [Cunninghamella echinulata]
VVNTIQKILNILDERGIITVKSIDENADADGPKDTRDKVVLELLETERKYVHDLEALQNYMRELHAQKVLPPDTIHYLFGNLNALVDFQRRFLIQLEDIAVQSPEEQRFGALFVQNEETFSVYEPYCSNFYSAQDLVVQETPNLQKLEHILNPTYQLPSMLIKPVQRICKYPLLQSELIKSTNKEWPYYTEMEEGLEAIKRVTEKVNETQRQHENIQAVEDLKKRVDDWRGINIEGYGSLLLHEKMNMTINDNAREVHGFFFERSLLFCKESKDASKNRLTKANTLSIRKKRAGTLQPKYLILINRIIGVNNKSQNGSWILSVDCKNREIDQFLLRFRNEEHLKLWESTLNKMTASNKSTVPNTHLLSMPLQQNGHISYFDDEDEEEDEEDDGDDDDDENFYQVRSRSNSISATLHHARSKMGLNDNIDPTIDHGVYPASPPPSKPASPTTSRLASSSSSSHHYNNNNSKNTSYSSNLMATSPSASSIHQTRVRSQSSPNIHKNNPHQWDDLPQMPINSRTYYQQQQQHHHSHHSQQQQYQHPSSPEQRSPTLTSVSTNGSGGMDTLKIKLSYNDGIYVIVCPVAISFHELMDKVEKKIKLVANLQPNDTLRLKYQDEDEDFITINSDDDVQMAFESRGSSSTMNLFVSH